MYGQYDCDFCGAYNCMCSCLEEIEACNKRTALHPICAPEPPTPKKVGWFQRFKLWIKFLIAKFGCPNE